jgi:tRNA threonylcarbamoyl adenosine modification protein (Sua5/YciO/YrdC/YwlC family)
MLIEIHPDNPQPRLIKQVVECLNDGGIIIYPTDTIYGIGCALNNNDGIEKICRIKGVKPEKATFSFLFSDISSLAHYTQPTSNQVFKLMRRTLPGPYTYILNASSNIPKIFRGKKKTVGIRIPDNTICTEIINMLNAPLLNTSVHDEDSIIEYSTDPFEIHQRFEKVVDIVIDGGIGKLIPSTVIDCTQGYPELIREGAGEIDSIFE